MNTAGIRGRNSVQSQSKPSSAFPAEMMHPVAAKILGETAECLAGLYGERLSSLTVEKLIIGVFFTGVKLSNGCAGVAYTPPEMIQRASTRILKGNMPRYRGIKVAEVLGGNLPGSFSSVILLATLNALSVPFFTKDRYTVTPVDDLSSYAQLFTGKRICMVGGIIPLLKRLYKLDTAEIVIVDKKEETKEEAVLGHFVPVEETKNALSRCQTAVFTGASIANGSIEELLSYVPQNAAVAIVGPTAGFIPDPLFRRRVAMVGTVVVTDSDQAMEILSEGGGAYQLFGRCVRKINLINQARIAELQNSAFCKE
jgi:uncharacterized protein